MARTELIVSENPHYIPGYTGFCPQYRYRCGETYGNQTHKLLLDPNVRHAKTLVLSNRGTDNYQVTRPHKKDIDVVDNQFKNEDPIYAHPMIPGYEGFVPRLNAGEGQRYSVLAIEGIADLKRQRLREEETLNQLRKVVALRNGQGESRDDEERLLLTSQFKLPMDLVRPDRCGIARHSVFEDATISSKNDYASVDFTSNYERRRSTEWAPITITRPDPPFLVQPSQIYQKHIGLIPNYLGHVPGATFRCGKTFGADTIDAKRLFRSHISD